MLTLASLGSFTKMSGARNSKAQLVCIGLAHLNRLINWIIQAQLVKGSARLKKDEPCPSSNLGSFSKQAELEHNKSQLGSFAPLATCNPIHDGVKAC